MDQYDFEPLHSVDVIWKETGWMAAGQAQCKVERGLAEGWQVGDQKERKQEKEKWKAKNRKWED